MEEKKQNDYEALYNSERYTSTFIKGQSLKRLLRLKKFFRVKSTDDVIDIGCGNGMLMPIIAPLVKTYTGVDISQRLIDSAKKRKENKIYPHISFICMGIEPYCNHNRNKYDVVFLMDISEHIADQDWLTILRSIIKTLRSNGTVYLHTPNAEYFLEILKKRGFLIKNTTGHIAIRSPSENRCLFERAGFSVKTTYLIPHYNFLRILHPLSLLPIVGKYFQARILMEAKRK